MSDCTSYSFDGNVRTESTRSEPPRTENVRSETLRSDHTRADTGEFRDGPQAGFRRTATRADILDGVYASCPSLSRGQAREIFEMALEEVAETLTRGEPVKLRSFGLFSVREKRERIGRNPRTGVEVPIKPRRVLTFKPSPVLLEQVNGRESGERDNGKDH